MKHHFIQSQIADWPGPPTFSPTGVTAIQLVGPNQKSSSLIPPHSRSRRVAWNSPPIPRQINRGAHCPTRSVAMHGYRLHSPRCGKTNPGHVSETVRACRAKVKKITTQISMEKLGGEGCFCIYIQLRSLKRQSHYHCRSWDKRCLVGYFLISSNSYL